MDCEVPDHPAASWPVGKSVAVALKIEKPNDLASVLGHELDSRLLVALLLTLDRVEERGVKERQHATPQPALLVALDVWANHDAHATSLAARLRAIKTRTVWRTKIPMLQATFPHAPASRIAAWGCSACVTGASPSALERTLRSSDLALSSQTRVSESACRPMRIRSLGSECPVPAAAARSLRLPSPARRRLLSLPIRRRGDAMGVTAIGSHYPDLAVMSEVGADVRDPAAVR